MKLRVVCAGWPAVFRCVAPAAFLVVLGCAEAPGERQITTVREFVPPNPWNHDEIETRQRFGFRVRSSPALSWETPPGWVERSTSQFRQANFGVSAHPDVECYLSVLRGGGGRMAENINRWRAQMGAAPLTPTAIEALQPVSLLGARGVQVEIDGTFSGMGESEGRSGYRLVGVLVEEGENAISLKMVGPAEAVEQEMANFAALRASFSLGDTASESAPAAPATESVGEFQLTWAAPSSWADGRTSSMRAATFHPGGDQAVECVVFVFQRPNGGDELSNIARWYGQMGHQLPAGGLEELPEIPVLGQKARLVKLEGTYVAMQSEPAEGYAMLAVYCGLPTHIVCVKLTGPADTVRAEEERFLEFCRSLRG